MYVRARALGLCFVTGAVIKWASLFVSCHRRCVFGRTDGHRHGEYTSHSVVVL